MLLLNKTVDIYRLTKTGSKESYPEAPTISDFACAILPASTEVLALYPASSQYAQFQVFTESMDALKEGDKLVDSANREWILRGVPESYDLGLFDYQWFMAEQVR